MTEPIVQVYFSWKSFMPDHRQYKQNSVVLEPQEMFIAVGVPIKAEYIFNIKELIVEGLYADKIDPILTPLGMRYCMDQLEAVVLDVPLQATDFDPDVEDDDDGWDKGELTEIKDGEEGW